MLPAALSSPTAYYVVAAAIAVASLAALRRIALAPFGFALRAARDSEIRADAIGIDTQRTRWLAFSLGGFFAGIAGALHALHKGSVFPTTLSIPVSVDALIMVLLGGIQTLIGPIVGALAYHGLSTELTRLTDHWRLFLGLAIVILAVVFPDGIVGFARRRIAKTAMSLLQLEQLKRSFGGVRAVDGVSFALSAGEIAALIGPNGAGKSTLFNLIDGQLAPQAGRVLFDGEVTDGMVNGGAHAARYRAHLSGCADVRHDDCSAERAAGVGRGTRRHVGRRQLAVGHADRSGRCAAGASRTAAICSRFRSKPCVWRRQAA